MPHKISALEKIHSSFMTWGKITFKKETVILVNTCNPWKSGHKVSTRKTKYKLLLDVENCALFNPCFRLLCTNTSVFILPFLHYIFWCH
jgi:hypothetical protein